MYARARAGIIKEFTGTLDAYKPPTDAEVVINTADLLPEEAAQFCRTCLRTASYGAIGAKGDAAVLGDLGGDVADAADIDVAVFFREAQLGGQVFAHQVGIEQGYGTSPDLQELGAQNIGDGGLSGAGQPSKENGQAPKVARRIAAAQFLNYLRISEPAGNVAAFI